jgi:hypothetical protein
MGSRQEFQAQQHIRGKTFPRTARRPHNPRAFSQDISSRSFLTNEPEVVANHPIRFSLVVAGVGTGSETVNQDSRSFVPGTRFTTFSQDIIASITLFGGSEDARVCRLGRYTGPEVRCLR